MIAMFENGPSRRHKHAAPVLIQIGDDAPIEARVFLAPGQRLLDLMNDDRAFLPISPDDGAMMIVAKQRVTSIIETAPESASEAAGGEIAPRAAAPHPGDDERAEDAPIEEEPPLRVAARGFDPFEFLGLAADAPAEEIRLAYKRRIKAVHPDRFSGAEGDEAARAAAVKATQRVNAAYREILKRRADAAGERADAGESAA